jgi:hypothetical protein
MSFPSCPRSDSAPSLVLIWAGDPSGGNLNEKCLCQKIN